MRPLPTALPISFLVLIAVLLGGCSQGTASDEQVQLGGEEIEIADWMEKPIVPELDEDASENLLEAVEAANEAGNRPGVFAKIGDSNSDFPGNLYGLGCRPVQYGSHEDMAPIRERFASQGLGGLDTFPGCRPANSFSRDSVAAVVGAWTEWVQRPIEDLRNVTDIPIAADDFCPGDISVLECELGLLEPRYATVMIGSNDVYRGFELGGTFRDSLEDLIDTVRDHDVVPILSTVAPMTESIDGAEERVIEANEVISELAEDEDVPLINLWRAMNEPQMVDRGLGQDGVHFNVFGGENNPEILSNSVVFTDEALRYGANRRNLIWLQTLDALERSVAAAAADDS